MTFAAVGSPIASNTSTFTLVPVTVGDFIIIEALQLDATNYVNALSSSNVTWSILVAPQVVDSAVYSTVFIGQVTSTSSATVTVTVNTGSVSVRLAGHEYSATAGYGAVTLDTSGQMFGTGGAFASLTPGHGSGELYFGYAYNSGTAVAGTTAGFTYYVDPSSNGACWDVSCGNGAQQPTWTDTTDTIYGVSVLLYESPLTYRATPAYGSAASPMSITKQSGTVASDWIFIYVSTDASPPNAASCTGFTASSVLSGIGADGTLLYRRADGTEGSTFSVTVPSGNPSYVIATIAGAGSVDPSVVAVPTSTSFGSSLPAGAITLTGTGDWVLWFAGSNNSPSSPPVITGPPGFTAGGSPPGTSPGCYVGHSTAFGAGSTGTQTGSTSPNGYQSAVMVGLTPSSPVYEDASTPAVVVATGTATVTTASFSPPANSLMMVLAWLFYNAQASSASDTWTVSDTHDGTWSSGTHIKQFSDTTNWSGSACLAAVLPVGGTGPGSLTVTVSNSDTGTSGVSQIAVAVIVLDSTVGVPAVGASGTGSVNGTTTTQRYGTVTTTTTGSLAFMTGGESYGSGTYTPVAGTSAAYLVSGYGGIARTAANTGTPGSTEIGWTSAAVAGGTDAFAWVAIEIVPGTAFSALHPLQVRLQAVKRAAHY